MPLETAIGEGDKRWDEIANGVRKLVAECLGKNTGEISYDAHFVKDLRVESLEMIDLVMNIEEEYDLSIPDKDLEEITTVRQAIDYVFERKYPQNNNLY